jgi:hypothetical protein
MAREVQRFSVTIPAGTPRLGALAFPLAMPTRIVVEVEIVVPPGPRGEVGFQLGSGGLQIVPATPGQFVVTDNEVIHWPLESQITSGAWQLIGYNTGSFDHTLEIRFLVDLVPLPGEPAGFQPIPNAALDSSGVG